MVEVKKVIGIAVGMDIESWWLSISWWVSIVDCSVVDGAVLGGSDAQLRERRVMFARHKR